MNPLSFDIYQDVAQLPSHWDLVAKGNIFLSTAYLDLLQQAHPENMRCYFIGLSDENGLVGAALAQFLDLSKMASFGDRDSCVKTRIREVVFQNLSSRVLFLGNNMLTGQNAYVLTDDVKTADALTALEFAMDAIAKNLRKEKLAPHLMVWKDFSQTDSAPFANLNQQDYFRFTTQPNMVFEIRRKWTTFDDYLADLHKKYRDQYKRARKKADGIEKRKMALSEIEAYENTIHELYMTVANGAPFNTFYLPKGHFAQLKAKLDSDFLFYGYFDNGKLVGFSTLIRNGCAVDTYFLGYDAECQREKMLYLNMLYDMTAYAINQGYQRIIFARTALEIKSSVGAAPAEMFGLMKHRMALVNKILPRLFKWFEPENIWQQRHPFKE